ncbi:YwdI family protein [Rossellomorea sp. AcN35-11]|nr:YwdI family protein [Rossellomorea aquimaris]NMH70653.1 YwdI family protein [Bacillus sp. RO3]WJV30647.1 YwdI family protein [Rossellomorea sp. AcN35-11]
MNIPHHTLIKKIELELGKAKSAEKSQTIREHVYSIKALCEVLLEENTAATSFSAQPSTPYFQESQPSQKPVAIQKEEPLETDDGANGNSLFDF